MKKTLLILVCLFTFIPLISFSEDFDLKLLLKEFPFEEYRPSQEISRVEYERKLSELPYEMTELLLSLEDLNEDLRIALAKGDEGKVKRIIIQAIEKVKRFREKYKDFPIRIDGFSFNILFFSINVGVL